MPVPGRAHDEGGVPAEAASSAEGRSNAEGGGSAEGTSSPEGGAGAEGGVRGAQAWKRALVLLQELLFGPEVGAVACVSVTS